MSHGHYTTLSVARRTGLSVHVVRIWEKRYAAVKPQRTGTNRQLYTDARAVALSIVYPSDDEHLPEELERLRRYLPSEVKIIVGGRASSAYSEAVSRIGALHSPDLKTFCEQLDSLRTPPKRKFSPS